MAKIAVKELEKITSEVFAAACNVVDNSDGLNAFIGSGFKEDLAVVNSDILPDLHKAMDRMEKSIAEFRAKAPKNVKATENSNWVDKITGKGSQVETPTR